MTKVRDNKVDFTTGNIPKNLIRFSIPLMAGNLLQQLYNIADTLIVGRLIGKEALAAVGSAYTIMIFLTSIVLGLCMGSSAFLSIQYGKGDRETFAKANGMAFAGIGLFCVMMNLLVYAGLKGILWFMQIPPEVSPLLAAYLKVIFSGIIATFLYNYFASSMRAIGNSVIPLVFLGVSALLNVALDIVFVAVFHWGVEGAAFATVLSQYVSGLGILLYAWRKEKILRIKRKDMRFEGRIFRQLASLAVLTSIQQSIMNFGILLVQGRVNYFGTSVMAAFAAAVKVDTFAYSPVQDFGNAFSTFVAQNHGSGDEKRIREGGKTAVFMVLVFGMAVSLIVAGFAAPLMGIFTKEKEIIEIGVGYLRIEGSFYVLIGFLFLLYGYFRAIEKPAVSIVLTVVSLGTRVVLSYTLSAVPQIGYPGIWASIPIGWLLADVVGYVLVRRTQA